MVWNAQILTVEVVPHSANNQGLSQDMQDGPDSFARGLGLSTQVIAEVNRGLDEEQEAIG